MHFPEPGMRIDDIAIVHTPDGSELTATFRWEAAARPPFKYSLVTHNAPPMSPDQAGNALLSVAFPIAFHDRESRLAIDGPVCPMLADNIATVLACWNGWAGGDPRVMAIETKPGSPPSLARTGATAFLSGGVDSFHMLQRNRKLIAPGQPAAIERAVLVHGFDIGKRARNAEEPLFSDIRDRLAAVCSPLGIKVATCRTNLRRIKVGAGFWTNRFYGAAVLGTGHAIAPGFGYLMLAGTYDLDHLAPIGSSPIVDVLFSSQRLQVIHEGLRFSRLQKLRELVEWPAAIDNLRVCANEGRNRYNCGTCEKCVRTRLGLLALGCARSAAFGDHAVDQGELDAIELTIDYHDACYREIADALDAGPHATLARGIRAKIASRAVGDLSLATT